MNLIHHPTGREVKYIKRIYFLSGTYQNKKDVSFIYTLSSYGCMKWIITPVIGIVAGHLFPNPAAYILGVASIASGYISAREYAMNSNRYLQEILESSKTRNLILRSEIKEYNPKINDLHSENDRLLREIGIIRKKLAENKTVETEYLVEKAIEEEVSSEKE